MVEVGGWTLGFLVALAILCVLSIGVIIASIVINSGSNVLDLFFKKRECVCAVGSTDCTAAVNAAIAGKITVAQCTAQITAAVSSASGNSQTGSNCASAIAAAVSDAVSGKITAAECNAKIAAATASPASNATYSEILANRQGCQFVPYNKVVYIGLGNIQTRSDYIGSDGKLRDSSAASAFYKLFGAVPARMAIVEPNRQLCSLNAAPSYGMSVLALSVGSDAPIAVPAGHPLCSQFSFQPFNSVGSGWFDMPSGIPSAQLPFWRRSFTISKTPIAEFYGTYTKQLTVDPASFPGVWWYSGPMATPGPSQSWAAAIDSLSFA